ncbi:MAG: hypothetical protein D6761_00225 [Candidatus Dadabacteria bacterium]|nr:MAG: hypothetical protein D6761_00225 [Candidatus Dadabacteria bacterium]
MGWRALVLVLTTGVIAAPAFAGTPDTIALAALNHGDSVAAVLCAVTQVQQAPFSPAASTVFDQVGAVPVAWLTLLRAEVASGILAAILAIWAVGLAWRRRSSWRVVRNIALLLLVIFGVLWSMTQSRVPYVVMRTAPLRVAPEPTAPSRAALPPGAVVLVRERHSGYALLSWPDAGWISLDHLAAGQLSECERVAATRRVSQK